MDAFYASVELRENPQLRGLPVVVAWDSIRSVVVAASYEARKYGLRSAMSVRRARELCPHAIYIAPNFMLYREVSRQVRSIFQQYTDRIEPLSLDEAYLDVTTNHKNIASATEVARRIREDIFLQTSLTASAGVAPNKFLALSRLVSIFQNSFKILTCNLCKLRSLIELFQHRLFVTLVT